MKKTFKSILAMILCAMIAITGIGTETAYAANNTSIKMTFNKKSVTLSIDDEKGVKSIKLSTLKKKWGKPDINKDEYLATYTWEKGKTRINYTDNFMAPERSNFSFETSDKNGALAGVKVGMKKANAKKALKKLGNVQTTITGLRAETTSGRVLIDCSIENGKITSISCQAYAEGLSK